MSALARIFRGQKALMEKYGEIERRNGCTVVPIPYEFGHEVIQCRLDDRFTQMRLKDLAYRAIEELIEASAYDGDLAMLSSASSSTVLQAAANGHKAAADYIEEVIDALHFIVEFTITTGLHEFSDVMITDEIDWWDGKHLNNLYQRPWCTESVIRGLGRTTHHLKNRPWKQTMVSTNRAEFQASLMLVWVYLTHLFVSLGMDPNDVAYAYEKKHEKNQQRIKGAY